MGRISGFTQFPTGNSENVQNKICEWPNGIQSTINYVPEGSSQGSEKIAINCKLRWDRYWDKENKIFSCFSHNKLCFEP